MEAASSSDMLLKIYLITWASRPRRQPSQPPPSELYKSNVFLVKTTRRMLEDNIQVVASRGELAS